jgi:hypothetical protein
MVVTASPLQAVRYKLAIDKYIPDKDTLTLRRSSRSREVIDADADYPYTEPNINGFPESQTAKRFDTDEYQVLIVAKKFQTGFDEPLLQTMFVDKPLSGLAALQTLSRLNRTCDSRATPSSSSSATKRTMSARRSRLTTGRRLGADRSNLLWDTRRRLDDSTCSALRRSPRPPRTRRDDGSTRRHTGRYYAVLGPARARSRRCASRSLHSRRVLTIN